MKLLKIENGQGQFLAKDNQLRHVDTISKDELLRLVDLTLSEDVEFDEYSVEAVKNLAHQIIYKSIFEKLRSLQDRKEEFIDQSKRAFLTEYEKYKDKSKMITDGEE